MSKPKRLQISLSQEAYDVVSQLAEFRGIPKATVITEVVHESYPVLARLVRILELSKAATMATNQWSTQAEAVADNAHSSLTDSLHALDEIEKLLSAPPHSNTGVSNSPSTTPTTSRSPKRGKKS